MELKHTNHSSNEEFEKEDYKKQFNHSITELILSTILDWMGIYFVAFKGDEEN